MTPSNIVFLLLLTVIIMSSALSELSVSPYSYEFPAIDYGDILTQNPSTGLEIANILTNLGFLQIKNIPSFSQFKYEALKPLKTCFDTSDEIVYETIMNDGSKRETVGGLSRNGEYLPIDNSCVDKSSHKLRAITDTVTSQMFQLLDKVSKPGHGPVMEPYMSYKDFIGHGEHLEHFHVYYPKESSSSNSQMTMSMHTDNGVMIAMTTGYYDENKEDKSGLYVELPSGIIARAGLDDNSLVIMVGEGARWTGAVLGAPLRPVPHSMIAGIKSSTRSWYGKMFLPPIDAILSSSVSPTSYPITYESYRTMTKAAVVTDSLPIACGEQVVSSSNSYLQLGGNDVCTASDGTAGIHHL